MRYFLRSLIVAAPALCLLVTTGCVPNRRWQPSTQPALPALTPAQKGMPVAVIEFDGMGELWDRCDLATPKPCQLRDAIDYIHKQRADAEDPETHQKKADVVVVTYVNGWHHNASPKDEDFTNFSLILQAMQTRADDDLGKCNDLLAKKLNVTCPALPTRFVGAYVTWRGRVIHGFLDYASAFDREKAAQRTALVSMSEVMVRLRNASKQTSHDESGQPENPARYLLFGHSYGGMIVERVMSQMLTASLLPEHQRNKSCGDGSVQRPFADLILMINPASDAIETEQLIDLMKRARVHVCTPPGNTEAEFNRPLIVAVHARNDFWTGTGFAIGHTIESTDKVFRPGQPCDFCDGGVGEPPSQSYLYKHTTAYIPYFHNYCYVNTEKNGELDPDPICTKIRNQLIASNPTGTLPTRAIPSKSAFNPALTNNLYLRVDPDAPGTVPWNNTPYWLFTLPKKLVDEHGGFWTPQFTGFVASIVQATTPPEGTSITMR